MEWWWFLCWMHHLDSDWMSSAVSRTPERRFSRERESILFSFGLLIVSALRSHTSFTDHCTQPLPHFHYVIFLLIIWVLLLPFFQLLIIFISSITNFFLSCFHGYVFFSLIQLFLPHSALALLHIIIPLNFSSLSHTYIHKNI